MSIGRVAGALALALGLWATPALAQEKGDKDKGPRKPEAQDGQDKDKGKGPRKPHDAEDKRPKGWDEDCDCACHHRPPGDTDGRKKPPPPLGDGEGKRKPPPPPGDGDKAGHKPPPRDGDDCCHCRPSKPDGEKGRGDKEHGNNGVGNGQDPQPPGKPPVNDDAGTGPGRPGNKDHGNGKGKDTDKDRGDNGGDSQPGNPPPKGRGR